MKLSGRGVARGEGDGQETEPEAEDRQAARLFQVLRKARHMAAQAITLPELGLLLRLVGAGQDEGVCGACPEFAPTWERHRGAPVVLPAAETQRGGGSHLRTTA